MPYKSVADLPERMRVDLPQHAQEIYKEVFNSAWDQYDTAEERRGDATREETAHKVAWSAVKHMYTKNCSGEWVEK